MERESKSCCSYTMCCGIPVEKGIFIFAIINAVICVLATLGSLAFLISALYPFFDGESRGSNDMVLVYMFIGIAVGCCVGTALTLTFAVLLILGVKKSNKRYLMAYLVYGICVAILSVGGCLGFLALEWGEKQYMLWTLIPLGVCGIYSLILRLVYQTYVMFSKRNPPTHIRLLNTSDS